MILSLQLPGTYFKYKDLDMTHSIAEHLPRFLLIAAAFAGTLVVAGCAGIGDTEISLLPSSKLADPLEVPPGLSPLPQPEQFVVPGELDPNSTSPPDLGPEQLRAYKLWLEFEEFKKYQDQIEGVGLSEEEFQYAKLSGEGVFRISTIEDLQAETIRLEVHDRADNVWMLLPSILADMSVFVLEVDNETRTILVSNTGEKQRRSILQRLRFQKFSGSIDKVQVRSVTDGKTQILGLSDLDIEVNPKTGREFFSRLRFYLLARYELEEQADPTTGQDQLGKQLIQGDDVAQVILLTEPFEATWVRVGRTLQGAGAGIQDIDRAQGIYYVSFAESAQQRKKKRNWKFWQRKAVEIPDQLPYQVFVKSRGEQTEVSVEYVGDTTGEDYDPKSAQKILLIIFDRLTA